MALTLYSAPLWGDVSIRQCIILGEASRARLATAVKADVEAKTLWTKVKADADKAMEATPSPIAVIHYEGLLDTDSKRVETEKHLVDMDRLAALTWAYSADPAAAYRDKMKAFILAWAETYKPTGNPINENKLEPVFCGYHLVGSNFSAAEKTLIENWMIQIASKEKSASVPQNNWEAKRLKIVGLTGMLLGRKDFIDFAMGRYETYVEKSLFSDGTSADLRERDALSYHVNGLAPQIVFALDAEQYGLRLNGKDLFRYVSPKNSSVEKSVLYVDPYAWGTEVRKEFENTKVELDRQRAEAGLDGYKPGTPFDPQSALKMYELAVAFKPGYMDLLRHLAKSEAKSYPTWLSLMAISANGGATSTVPAKLDDRSGDSMIGAQASEPLASLVDAMGRVGREGRVQAGLPTPGYRSRGGNNHD